MTQPSRDIVAAARVASAVWHIPASVQLAQFALESAWGTKTSGPFNYFGMKAINGQPSVMVSTHEVYKGVRVAVMQPFRKFDSAIEAFDAHAKLLATGKPYAPFRAKLPDIRAAVYELGGGTPADPRYATAPRKTYGDTMWALISPSGNNLMQYDL